MPLTYHDVMTTQLHMLLDAAKAWKKMGNRFGELKTNLEDHVLKVTGDGSWRGEGFQAATSTAGVIKHEYGAAKAEALAIAQILQEAYTQFHGFKQSIEKIVRDAESKGYKVNAHTGEVLYDWERLTPEENRAMKNDPENGRVIAKAERDFTGSIKTLVQKVNDADHRVQLALNAAVTDQDGKGALLGFNSEAEGDLEKAGGRGASTQTDGWRNDGKVTATGPDVGFSATGPAYGKQGMLKAYADLGHWTAEGSRTNGNTKLSGIADGYVGARGTASAGMTDSGISGNAEVSAGARALAEGRIESPLAGAYGRTTGFAGGEAGINAGVGPDGFKTSAEAFAGAKGSVAGGTEVGGIGAGTTAEGWVGPGAEADLKFGKGEDGKFRIGAKGGISPGLGGALGFEVTVDPGKVADTASDAAGAVGDAAGSAKDAVTGLF